MTVVPMRPSHIEALMVHERAMFGPEAWSAHSYRAELADTRSRRYVVALDGDELVGWAGVMLLGEEAEVLTVGVVPGRRREGIGALLLQTLQDRAAAEGAGAIYLEVRVDNAAALALYETRGYQRVGLRRGYYEHGRVDAVVMRRDLATAP